MSIPSASPLAGWYVDAGGGLRWWDGERWTDRTRAVTAHEQLTRQLRVPDWATRPIIALTGAAWLVSFSVAAAALVRQRPLDHAGLLLVMGIPVLVLGQLAAIASVVGRQPRPASLREAFSRSRQLSSRGQYFGALPSLVTRLLSAVAMAGWLIAMTGIQQSWHGSPDRATPGCPYRLIDHGRHSCVTEMRYEAAGAGIQRFAAGILSGFFCLQCGVALNVLAERRRALRETDT